MEVDDFETDDECFEDESLALKNQLTDLSQIISIQKEKILTLEHLLSECQSNYTSSIEEKDTLKWMLEDMLKRDNQEILLKQNTSLEEKLKQQKAAIDMVRENLQKNMIQIEHLRNEKQHSEKELLTANDQIRKLELSNEDIRLEGDKLHSDLTSLENKMTVLNSEKEELQNQLKKTMHSLTEVKQENYALHSQESLLKNADDLKSKMVMALKEQVEDKSSHIVKLEAEILSLRQLHAKTKEDLEASQIRIQQSKDSQVLSFETKEKQIVNLQEQLESEKHSRLASEAMNAVIHERILQLENEIQAANSRISILQSENSAFQANSNSVATELAKETTELSIMKNLLEQKTQEVFLLNSKLHEEIERRSQGEQSARISEVRYEEAAETIKQLKSKLNEAEHTLAGDSGNTPVEPQVMVLTDKLSTLQEEFNSLRREYENARINALQWEALFNREKDFNVRLLPESPKSDCGRKEKSSSFAGIKELEVRVAKLTDDRLELAKENAQLKHTLLENNAEANFAGKSGTSFHHFQDHQFELESLKQTLQHSRTNERIAQEGYERMQIESKNLVDQITLLNNKIAVYEEQKKCVFVDKKEFEHFQVLCETEKKNSELQTECDHFDQALSFEKKLTADLRKRIQDLLLENSSTHNALQEAEKKCHQLSQNLVSKQNEVQALQSQITENSADTTRLSKLSKQVDILQEELMRSTRTIEGLQNDAVQKEALKNQVYSSQISSLEASLEQERKQKCNIENQLKILVEKVKRERASFRLHMQKQLAIKNKEIEEWRQKALQL
eukprot:GCRY01003957.1.p1 GENE.GCRY01003957.1~~GCRY01003957.1.p1  ORF type:complete len:791 (-),score=155.46 GCRY01003957.1:113-2485(-)